MDLEITQQDYIPGKIVLTEFNFKKKYGDANSYVRRENKILSYELRIYGNIVTLYERIGTDSEWVFRRIIINNDEDLRWILSRSTTFYR